MPVISAVSFPLLIGIVIMIQLLEGTAKTEAMACKWYSTQKECTCSPNTTTAVVSPGSKVGPGGGTTGGNGLQCVWKPDIKINTTLSKSDTTEVETQCFPVAGTGAALAPCNHEEAPTLINQVQILPLITLGIVIALAIVVAIAVGIAYRASSRFKMKFKDTIQKADQHLKQKESTGALFMLTAKAYLVPYTLVTLAVNIFLSIAPQWTNDPSTIPACVSNFDTVIDHYNSNPSMYSAGPWFRVSKMNAEVLFAFNTSSSTCESQSILGLASDLIPSSWNFQTDGGCLIRHNFMPFSIILTISIAIELIRAIIELIFSATVFSRHGWAQVKEDQKIANKSERPRNLKLAFACEGLGAFGLLHKHVVDPGVSVEVDELPLWLNLLLILSDSVTAIALTTVAFWECGGASAPEVLAHWKLMLLSIVKSIFIIVKIKAVADATCCKDKEEEDADPARNEDRPLLTETAQTGGVTGFVGEAVPAPKQVVDAVEALERYSLRPPFAVGWMTWGVLIAIVLLFIAVQLPKSVIMSTGAQYTVVALVMLLSPLATFVLLWNSPIYDIEAHGGIDLQQKKLAIRTMIAPLPFLRSVSTSQGRDNQFAFNQALFGHKSVTTLKVKGEKTLYFFPTEDELAGRQYCDTLNTVISYLREEPIPTSASTVGDAGNSGGVGQCVTPMLPSTAV